MPYLFDNRDKIINAIVETWSNKENVIFDPEQIAYKEDGKHGAGFYLKINYFGVKSSLYYLEEDHNKETPDESIHSFLDDLNTDVTIVEIGHQYPALGIVGGSWPDQYVELKNGSLVRKLAEFYDPKTGVFNIQKFQETRKEALSGQRNATSRGGFVFVENIGINTSDLPETFKSTLSINPDVLLQKDKPNLN